VAVVAVLLLTDLRVHATSEIKKPAEAGPNVQWVKSSM